MKDKLITTREKNLKKRPNLVDYEKAYRRFSWKQAEAELAWFAGKRLNAAFNAVDRHLSGPRKNKVALYWEGEDGEKKKFTFAELSRLSSKFANVLKKLGVERGNRVFFFLPRVPEIYFGFLGAIKAGAIAGTLFSAFGPQAIFDRLESSSARILVTNKTLLPRVSRVRKKLPHLEKILLVDEEKSGKEFLSLSKLMEKADEDFEVAQTLPSDPAFMLYTSGTTGKPKGVVHQQLAILTEHQSAKWALDLSEDDVYWCTADPGWVTGIAYEILGSWSNGASTLVYEGRFDPEKWYQLIDEYGVNVWYTAPTAIRMLAAAPIKLSQKYDFSSLRHLASVGEPLNPDSVYWGIKIFKLPFHDNYWQTETGGIVIANFPSLPIKPGSMGKPLPGIFAAVVDDKGRKLPPGKEGNLALAPSWPSMMTKIWRRPEKYDSYFVNGWYITGDRAVRDRQGYFWFVGRSDDVIKTAGERVGPFEVESALVSHPAVIEAAVIGKPDPIRGEIIKAFVALASGYKGSKDLLEKLQKHVKTHLSGHAYPREIEFVDKLPKTRSGKIVRRLLRAKELGLPLGDTSTLEEF